MRLEPLHPDALDADLRSVHDTVADFVARSMPQVVSQDPDGSLIGPYTAMLHFPRYGVPALQFIAAVNSNSQLPATVRETVILTVGAAYNCRYELYAHEVMGQVAGLTPAQIATLASGSRPPDLNAAESTAYDVAQALASGRILPASTYTQALTTFGRDGLSEMIFLTGTYCLIATILNAFDVPVPEPAGNEP